MREEIAVIYKILKEQDLKFLVKENLTKELFTENRDIFLYILDYFDLYSKLPEYKTVVNAFPYLDLDTFTDESFPENLSYYADIVRRKKKFDLILDYNKYININIEDQLEGCVKKSFSLVDELNLYTNKGGDLIRPDFITMIKDDYAKRKEGGGIVGIPYRWDKLNELTGGLQKYFVTLTGNKKVGKTFFFCCLIVDLLLKGQKVLLFSREMSSKEMLRRIVAIKYNLPYNRFRNGELTEDEEHIIRHIGDDNDLENLIINEDIGFSGSVNIRYILSRINLYKPDFVFIDGVYLLDDNQKSMNRVERLYNITRDLKVLSNSLNIGVVGTTQQNVDSNKKAGGTTWSRSFEQDSDIVILLEEVENDKRVRKVSIPYIRDGKCDDAFFINFDPEEFCNFDENLYMSGMEDNVEVN